MKFKYCVFDCGDTLITKDESHIETISAKGIDAVVCGDTLVI